MEQDFAVPSESYRFLSIEEVFALGSYAPSTIKRKDKELCIFNAKSLLWWNLGKSVPTDKMPRYTALHICMFTAWLAAAGWSFQSVVYSLPI